MSNGSNTYITRAFLPTDRPIFIGVVANKFILCSTDGQPENNKPGNIK